MVRGWVLVAVDDGMRAGGSGEGRRAWTWKERADGSNGKRILPWLRFVNWHTLACSHRAHDQILRISSSHLYVHGVALPFRLVIASAPLSSTPPSQCHLGAISVTTDVPTP